VPRKVKLDNLKAGVTMPDIEHPQFQRSYRECAEHYGFMISPCRVRTPEHKGKVESGVKYVKGAFLSGRDYTQPERSVVQANRDLDVWVRDVAGVRNHGTTHERPLEAFEQRERAALMALPRSTFECVTWHSLKVGRDGYVSFRNSYYSAPERLIGERIDARVGAHKIALYDTQDVRVAVHELSQKAGVRRTDALHVNPHKARASQSLEVLREQVEAVGPHSKQLADTWLADASRDPHVKLLRMIEYAGQAGAAVFEQAALHALEVGQPTVATLRQCLGVSLGSAALPHGQPQFARSPAELLGDLA
jgi:hypothetical protein